MAKNRDLTLPEGLEIIDPDNLDMSKYIAAVVERRKGKTTAEVAAEYLKDTVYLGTIMLQLDEVDGLVSGAIHTTANTVRPAFQLIKTAPQYSLVSSVFFMLLPEQVVVYGDCAINLILMLKSWQRLPFNQHSLLLPLVSIQKLQ